MSDKYYSKHTRGYKCHSFDSCKPSWKVGTFCPNLGKNNKRSMDPNHSKGLQNRISYHALSGLRATPTEIQSGTTTPSRTGSKQTSRQGGGDPNESVTSGEIHIHPISGTKKGRWSETSHQSEMPECIRGVPTLQDRRHTDLQEPCETRGLVSEGRPKGRLFFHPDPSRSQEIPMFPTGGENLPVHLPPVRPDLSTLGLYQDPQTDSSSRTRVGISSCNLHRRYPADGGVEGDDTRTGLSPSISSPVPGVHHKLREDHIATNSNTRVPGFRREHIVDGVKPPKRETKKDSGGVSEALGGGANIRPCPLQTNWQDECCPLSHSTSTSVLQISTDGSDGGFEEGGSKLRYSPLFVGEQQGRASLVGHTDGTLERENHPDTGSGVDHRVRRLDSLLGSDVSGVRHGRTLVGTREDMAHKLPGASGSYTSAENVCKKQNESVSSAQAGQLFGSGLYKQSGRNNLKETCLLDSRSMDVVPGKEYTHPSSTPARHTADRESRSMRDRSDWKLDSQTFAKINRLYGPLEVDLFASRLTYQCHRYFSWRPDPFAEAIDAFLQDWSTVKGFANPPWSLIPRVLNQVQTEEADLILVTPLWKAQPWYALLLSMLVDWPSSLPQQELLTPVGKMSLNPRLVVWSISGKASKIKVFQSRLQASLSSPGGLRQTNLTTHSLSDGIAGVVRGVPIPFQDL